MGSSDMPIPIAPGPVSRYTFGSGARPLDGYTIKRAIGRGGFGEVYYATSDSGKEVALKLILRNLEVERRGVVQCMNLKCPNLLTIHDLKTNDGGDTFVIMEYVAGPSLASVLAQHPEGMPLGEVRAWLKGLVEGVAYLHDHGIVHRDLKPANLFMEEGIVKIGDYGLAKLITPSQGTEHSESIGTCHYMAPEIASGKYHKPIDVYAIGVILYEMLTGRVPFEGETVGEVLMKHLTARPDLSPLPEPYRTIVGRALAKDPNQRPSRVYDLLPPEDAPRTPSVRFIGEGRRSRPPGRGRSRRRPEPRRSCGSRPRSRSSTSGPRRGRPAGGADPGAVAAGQTQPAIRTADRMRGGAAQQQLRRAQPVARRSGPAQARRAAGSPRPRAVNPASTSPGGSRLLVPPRRVGGPSPPRRPPRPRPRAARSAGLAQRPGPDRRAGRLDALGRPGRWPCSPSPPPRRWTSTRRGQPQQVAYLYRTGLLGTWTTLIPTKVVETRQLDGPSRRLDRRRGWWLTGVARSPGEGPAGRPEPQDRVLHPKPPWLLPAYFAALYAITAGWLTRTTRDRTSRFRIRTMLWTAWCRRRSSRSGRTSGRTTSPSRP